MTTSLWLLWCMTVFDVFLNVFCFNEFIALVIMVMTVSSFVQWDVSWDWLPQSPLTISIYFWLFEWMKVNEWMTWIWCGTFYCFLYWKDSLHYSCIEITISTSLSLRTTTYLLNVDMLPAHHSLRERDFCSHLPFSRYCYVLLESDTIYQWHSPEKGALQLLFCIFWDPFLHLDKTQD